MAHRIKLRNGYTITTRLGAYRPSDGSFGDGVASERHGEKAAWAASYSQTLGPTKTLFPYDTEAAAIKAARAAAK